MRSHFLPQKVSAVCAVAGATTLLSGSASAQNFVAADYATNSTYIAGWSAGQNGGYGFGAWSFDGTQTNAGQVMSSAAAIGRAWTLFLNKTGGGISTVGRPINEPGGLQPGQTFEAIVQNPSSYHYYGGWDILFLNGANNLPGGVNQAALRVQVFNSAYFDPGTVWLIDDYDHIRYGSSDLTILPAATTAVAGMKLDLTLTSTNTYLATLTPLNNPSAAYSQTGRLATTDSNGNAVTNLPINYINFRLYNNVASGGPNDTTNNYEISSVSIAGTPLNIQLAGTNAILSWSTNVPGFYLESTPNLNSPIVWTSNSIAPATVSGLNVVTNRVTGQQQYFRLQLQQ
jgi:hypothetical protein